ncbi:hypothetical protein [Ornithinimicrobium sp. INDO-MA30-4]|uniref:hypothetical protein n=1 Tax=Ornithinimicrobium sp. INDO-MA30-4 TaxID=2908651 RepID=UPI001F2607D0|nr:hypothetical protein [Ornithinimicrobium sp. INDO-MA30-4]UJH70176.1 hypothetical protein L0A91_13455 [Ornithinimicrobium sp. INDO-MA30-4]
MLGGRGARLAIAFSSVPCCFLMVAILSRYCFSDIGPPQDTYSMHGGSDIERLMSNVSAAVADYGYLSD